MSYAEIDPIIRAWSQKHGFTLFERVEGDPTPVRSVYLSSPQGACFQIWIDQPRSSQVALHAADVETRDDEELRQDWSVPVSSLAVALDHAVLHVREWMGRK